MEIPSDAVVSPLLDRPGVGLALSDSCFKEVTLVLKIFLSPKYIGDAMVRGIHEKLNQFLMKYVEELDGVMLAYWNLSFLDNHARILFERPELHFRIQLDALLFSPTPNSHLVGQVNKVGEDHIGLLILGIFNASITLEEMGQFSFLSSDASGLSSDWWQHRDNTEQRISLGTEIRFKVKSVNVGDDGMVSITGALDSKEETGPTTSLTELLKRTKKGKRKHKAEEQHKQHKKHRGKEHRTDKGKEKVKGDKEEMGT